MRQKTRIFVIDAPSFPSDIMLWIIERRIEITSRSGEYGDQLEPQALLKELRSSDAVVFRPRGALSATASFELGVSIGLKLPIFILSDEQHDPLPVSEPDAQLFLNLSGLEFAIEQLDHAIQLQRTPDEASDTLPSLRQRRLARRFTEYLKEHATDINEATFESQLQALLRSTQPDTLAVGDQDDVFDFAIWDAELGKAAGSPILIQAKLTAPDGAIRQVQTRLSSLGSVYSDAVVLLIWFDGFAPRRLSRQVIPIHALSLGEELGHGVVTSEPRRQLHELLADGLETFDVADTNHARGVAYENVAATFLAAAPGIVITARNVLNEQGNHEIDIAGVNKRLSNGLHFLAPVFLAEVKGWERPIGSRDIAWFATKLRARSLKYGFLFAAAGLTGDFTQGNAGHAELAGALQAGQSIIVITRGDIESVRRPKDVVATIMRRLTELIVGRVLLP
jgi:hypothetical protein